jgi:HEAT repeat protein
MARLNPFSNRVTYDKTRYGLVPADRIEELRSMAKQAEQLSATRQQLVSEQLSTRLDYESDPIIRREIVTTLSAYSTPGAIAGLNKALQDKDAQVRIAACDAWKQRGGPAAVDALATTLGSDMDIDVRLAATSGLGSLRDPKAVRALAVALDDPDPALQYRAMQSLQTVSDQDLGNDVNAWRQYAQNLAPATSPSDSMPGPQVNLPVAEKPSDSWWRR